jgi:hypothetical protein
LPCRNAISCQPPSRQPVLRPWRILNISRFSSRGLSSGRGGVENPAAARTLAERTSSTRNLVKWHSPMRPLTVSVTPGQATSVEVRGSSSRFSYVDKLIK